MFQAFKKTYLIKLLSRASSRRTLGKLVSLPALLYSILSILFFTTNERTWAARSRLHKALQDSQSAKSPAHKPSTLAHHSPAPGPFHNPHSPRAHQIPSSPSASSTSSHSAPSHSSTSLSPTSQLSPSSSQASSFHSSPGVPSPFSPGELTHSSPSHSPANSPRANSPRALSSSPFFPPSPTSSYRSLTSPSQRKNFRSLETPQKNASGGKSPLEPVRLPPLSRSPAPGGAAQEPHEFKLSSQPGVPNLLKRRMQRLSLTSSESSTRGSELSTKGGNENNDAANTLADTFRAPSSEAPGTHLNSATPAGTSPLEPKLGFRDRFRNRINGPTALDLSETRLPGERNQEEYGEHKPATHSYTPKMGFIPAPPSEKGKEEISLGKGANAQIVQKEITLKDGTHATVAAKQVNDRELEILDQLSSNPNTRDAIIPMLAASRQKEKTEDQKEVTVTTAYLAKAEKILRGDQSLKVDRAAQYTASLFKNLHKLHQEGYVHKDVKPANVLLLNGEARLSDLGSTARMNDLMSKTKEEYLKGTTEPFRDPRIEKAPTDNKLAWDQVTQADLWAAGKTALQWQKKTLPVDVWIKQEEVDKMIDEAYPNNPSTPSGATNALLKSIMKVNQSAPLDLEKLTHLENQLKNHP